MRVPQPSFFCLAGAFVSRDVDCYPPALSSRSRALVRVRMGLRPTHRDENRAELMSVGSSWRGTVKVVPTLDEVRPCPSLIWNVRFEPICVAPPVPAGRVVARDGV
jgi:hypothetical protein